MKSLKVILLCGLAASLGACQKYALPEDVGTPLSKTSQFNADSLSSIAGTSWALVAISSGTSSKNVASYNQTLSFSSNDDVTVSPGSIGSGSGFSPGNTGSGVVPGGQEGQAPQGPVNTPNQLVNGPGTQAPNIIQNPPVSSNQLQEFNGHAACNNFGGTFLDKDGAINNVEVMASRMSCAALGVEEEYLGALDVAVSYVVNGNNLTIRCQNGVRLRFTRQ
jgi:heat shock protein HslJ